MPTVANLIATNFVGGPEKQILTQSIRLSSHSFRPLIISFKEGTNCNELINKAKSLSLAARTLETKHPFHPGVILDLCRIIRTEKVDVLCGHGYKSNIVGRLASWMTGIPFVAISRGWTAESARICLYERLDKYFLKHADHVVAVSGGQRQKILSLGLDPERISVIHNAIDLDNISVSGAFTLHDALGLPHDSLIVATAGRLSPEKNQTAMIAVAREVVACNSHIYFVVFGEGFLRKELEQQVAAAGLEKHFLLPGFRRDLQTVLHDIDIFMLPSFTEGLPNVVLEAFAARKPVVASAVGGTPEIVTDGVSGYLTKPTDVAAMTKAIYTLAADRNLQRRMGEAGYRHIAEHFTFEAQTRKYEELYVAIHNRRHAGA